MSMGKGRQTRQEILRHALREASKIGLESLSIGTLAKDIGMSKSGLFAHFGSKEGLQIAVLQHGAQRFIQAVMLPTISHPRGLARIHALTENWLAWTEGVVDGGGCVFVSSTFEFDDRSGPVRDTIVVLMQQLEDNLRRCAAIAVEAGDLRADLDIDAFAFHWHSLLIGHHVHARLFRKHNARERVHAALNVLLLTAAA